MPARATPATKPVLKKMVTKTREVTTTEEDDFGFAITTTTQESYQVEVDDEDDEDGEGSGDVHMDGIEQFDDPNAASTSFLVPDPPPVVAKVVATVDTTITAIKQEAMLSPSIDITFQNLKGTPSGTRKQPTAGLEAAVG